MGITGFSRFVTELNHRALEEDAEGLAGWAVGELSKTLGFDAAWYGWATLRTDCVEVYANATLNLPDDYHANWLLIADQDLLAAAIVENPDSVAQYDRRQRAQSDGMAYLADRYGLTRMATAMNGGVNSFASFYLSSYRVGTNSRAMTDDDRDFLKCAVDQLSGAMKLSPIGPGRPKSPSSVSLLVSESGIGLLGLSALREQFGDIWPRWTGDHLPEQLSRLIGRAGVHILPDRQLVVTIEATPRFQGVGLWRLTLRRLTKIDLLTNREKQIVSHLCAGQSAKEVALSLGIATATVRNQTQSIYHKLEVDNRAALALVANGF